jgi:peptidyl-prolyl cis-trans isomerase SurA
VSVTLWFLVPLLAGGLAHGAVVERVVAVVGERAILLSDLRARARPFLLRVYRDVPPGAQRTAAISQMYELLLSRMVDDELEQLAANRAHIAVTSAEIDQAIERVAAQNGLTVAQIIAEAARGGMTKREYRREIRRQLLDAKLLNLRLTGRIRITPDDLRSHYQRLVKKERERLRFRAAWIVIKAGVGASRRRAKRARARAARVAAEAGRGADFGALARQHSDDSATRNRGGLLDPSSGTRLPQSVRRWLLAVNPGEVSTPIRTGDRFVIVKLIEREESSLPSFEESREELHQRVYMEKMNKARRHWLDSLRRRSHVEIRL